MSTKHKQQISAKYKNGKSKKDTRLAKLAQKLESDEESEHELSHYVDDRVKLMKEVLKIIKPKKIKNMAPDCIKHLDIEEINSMLLEELLGISNKRLKYIFNGQNLDEDSSSSTDPEADEPIDLISLDEISDDDFHIIDVDAEKPLHRKTTKNKKHTKIKQEKSTNKKIKKEKKQSHNPKQLEEGNLMSVLELLELQARARAIRSQLVLESSKKIIIDGEEAGSKNVVIKDEDESEDDAVIIESPKYNEIVITSSSDDDSDLEMATSSCDAAAASITAAAAANTGEQENRNDVSRELPSKRKITLFRDRYNKRKNNEKSSSNSSKELETSDKDTTNIVTGVVATATTTTSSVIVSSKEYNEEKDRTCTGTPQNDTGNSHEVVVIEETEEINTELSPTTITTTTTTTTATTTRDCTAAQATVIENIENEKNVPDISETGDKNHFDGDEIVINLDQDEMDCIEI